MAAESKGELLDVEQIGHYLGLLGARRTRNQKVYTMIARKEIPAFKLAGRWYCRKVSLLTTLELLESKNFNPRFVNNDDEGNQ